MRTLSDIVLDSSMPPDQKVELVKALAERGKLQTEVSLLRMLLWILAHKQGGTLKIEDVKASMGNAPEDVGVKISEGEDGSIHIKT